MEQGQSQSGGPPPWVPDSEALQCAVCSATFGVITRRHHCRACGGVVCGACSPHRLRLPDLHIHTVERVCARCFKEHALEAEWEADTFTARYYLRLHHPGLVVSAPLFDTCRRDAREKSIFLVTDTASGKEFALSVVAPGTHCTVPYGASQAARLALQRVLLGGVHHPYVWPITSAAFVEDRCRALIMVPWAPRGSLRDAMHRASPKSVYGEKYATAAARVQYRHLSAREVALYGRQVLEAMVYLKSRGLRSRHVHAGNVLLHDGVCSLSGVIENELLGIPPAITQPSSPAVAHQRAGIAADVQGPRGANKDAKPPLDLVSSVSPPPSHAAAIITDTSEEAYAFGRLLFEMLFAQPLPCNRLPRPLPKTPPAPFGEVLKTIFSASDFSGARPSGAQHGASSGHGSPTGVGSSAGGPPSLESLLHMDVFAKVPPLLADVGYIHQPVLDPACLRLLAQVVSASHATI